MEGALYSIVSMQLLTKISFDNAIQDHTTIIKFRPILEKIQLSRALFKAVNKWLSDTAIALKEGTLVDIKFIETPTSIKSKSGKREPASVLAEGTKPRKGINGILVVRPESRMYICFAGYVHLTKPVVSPTVPYPDVRSR